MAVDPTNEFGLISASDDFTSATTLTSSASFTFNVSPSRDLTVIIVPSICSTVPRTRIGLSCANAAEANSRAHAAPIIVKVFTRILPKRLRRPKWLRSNSEETISAYLTLRASGCGQHRASWQEPSRPAACRLHDDDLRSRLEFILVAR